jgi:flavin-dependent dehydrogenase
MSPSPSDVELERDVIVLGGGLAGLAAATHLARAGIQVLCVDPSPCEGVRVGESLDWAAPQLLANLGFEARALLDDRVATRKRHLRVLPDDGPAFELAPEPWFARAPLSLELETLHLDRERFDRALLAAAQRAGVEVLRERVSSVHVADGRVEAVETRTARLRARRYVDASGAARLVGRALGLPVRAFGRTKVSLWTYLPSTSSVEGTTLHLSGGDEYLRWIWEIPIAPDVLSVGLTLSAEELKRRLPLRGGVEAVMRGELEGNERLAAALASAPELRVHARTFRCSVQGAVSGPNWLSIGEAAAMIDPLTSNGFTFALRFAEHAAELIERSLHRSVLPAVPRHVFDTCLRRTAHAFNEHIERIAYAPSLRVPLGLQRATRVYVVFGFFCNAFCQRLRPRGLASSLLLRVGLAAFRLWRLAWALGARRPTARLT